MRSQISMAWEYMPYSSSNSAYMKQKVPQCCTGVSFKSLSNIDLALSTPTADVPYRDLNLSMQEIHISQREGHLKLPTANSKTLKVSSKQASFQMQLVKLMSMTGVRHLCSLQRSQAILMVWKFPMLISRSMQSCQREVLDLRSSSMFLMLLASSLSSVGGFFLRKSTCLTTLRASWQKCSSNSISHQRTQTLRQSSNSLQLTLLPLKRISLHPLKSLFSCRVREYSTQISDSLPFSAYWGFTTRSASSIVAKYSSLLLAFLWSAMSPSQDLTLLGLFRMLILCRRQGCRRRSLSSFSTRCSIQNWTLSASTTSKSFCISALARAVIISCSNLTQALKMIPKSLALSILLRASSRVSLALSKSPSRMQQSLSLTHSFPESSGQASRHSLILRSPGMDMMSSGCWEMSSTISKKKSFLVRPFLLWQRSSDMIFMSIRMHSSQSFLSFKQSEQFSLKSGLSCRYLGTTFMAVLWLSSRIAHRLNLCQIFSCWVRGRFLKDQLYTERVLLSKCCFYKIYAYIIQILGIFGNFSSAFSKVSFSSLYSLETRDREEQKSINSAKYMCHILQEQGRNWRALLKSYFLSFQGRSLWARRVLDQARIEYLVESSPSIWSGARRRLTLTVPKWTTFSSLCFSSQESEFQVSVLLSLLLGISFKQ